MTTESCPTCKGECCVNKRGSVVEHGSALALHSCPDCDAGLVWTAYTDRAPRPARTAEDERADLLAYLAYGSTLPFPYPSDTVAVLNALRDLIGQGMHEGWAKKEKKT
jgi:hypothetical protein